MSFNYTTAPGSTTAPSQFTSPARVAAPDPVTDIDPATSPVPDVYNRVFSETTSYVCDIDIIRYKFDNRCYENEDDDYYYESEEDEEETLVFKYEGYYYTSDISIYEAIHNSLARLHPQVCRKIAKSGTLLFTVPLFRRKDSQYPSMFVHRNNVFDIGVPIDIVFSPKIDNTASPSVIAGPPDRSCEVSKSTYCKDCAVDGCYNGVFVALCVRCVNNVYKDKYLGFSREYSGEAIGFYDIPPERRYYALPLYMHHLYTAPDYEIGYIDNPEMEIIGCSANTISAIEINPDTRAYYYPEFSNDLPEIA
jgi:hypothetical protein